MFRRILFKFLLPTLRLILPKSQRSRAFPPFTKLTKYFGPTSFLRKRIMASTTTQPASEAASTPGIATNVNGKRSRPGAHRGQRGGHQKKMKKTKSAKEGSAEEVLMADIEAMLKAQKLEDSTAAAEGAEKTEETEPKTDEEEKEELPEPGSEIEVEVHVLSSTGDGLARQPGRKQIYVVSFGIPGDILRVKVYRHLPALHHSIGDFLSVVKPSPLRDDARVSCGYFGRCTGCQFQMLSYADQLAHKRAVVERAFARFSHLPPELVPAVGETMGSPLQYGYRTKLTPHFDGPPGSQGGRRGRAGRQKVFWDRVPETGFMQKGSRRTLDIEDCPIGTEAVRKGMARERKRMGEEFGKYERGATILLREDTKRIPKGDEVPEPLPEGAVKVETGKFTDVKTCITDSNATSTEYIDDFVFTNPAGSFFQNNNSILPSFTDYIRQHILPPPSSSPARKPIRYLIDAYSGSGLFTITLSSLFPGGSIGIDIAGKSIDFARANAALNGLPEPQCRFIAADAPELFKSVRDFDPDETTVVLDPPRKGCDASFLTQLLGFAPRRVVYVSCNVHTQARDVGVLVRGEVEWSEGDKGLKEEGAEEKEKPKPTTRYEIESVRGFDFFPQTSHVEGVAVLNRVIEG